MADWLDRSEALGRLPDGPAISAAQLSRRGQQLGLRPYLFCFIGLAW
ncbi:MAG TPA: hypothetical protein VNL96_00340 [Gemmatimonadaceae bacterium]|nr:hypothetical protein [Gemmatimonadaceae bacterium]